MRVYSRSTLVKFWKRHADAKTRLEYWYQVAVHASWQSMDDINRRFSQARPIKNQRVVFKIGGNSYRLVAKLDFTRQAIWIRFIGTHAEYDRIDASTV